jgi:GT2 family glycosyltransferase
MKGMVRKLCFPVRGDKDVVFAITPEYDRQGRPTSLHASFPEASLNGMVMHRNTFQECGDLSDNPLFLSKTFWCLEAIQNGYTFKGVLTKAL